MNLLILGIIAANCLASFQGFNDYNFRSKYLFHIGSIRAGEQIRFLTSGFLHADIMHLVFNMYTLYMFGPILAENIGNVNFLLVYLISLLAGNFLSFALHKNEPHYSALGASGAVMGVIYAYILLYPDSKIFVFFIPMKSYIFGILYLLYSIYGMKAKNDNIGHDAHLGGAVGGLGFMLIKYPELLSAEPLIIALMVIPIIVFGIMAKMGKI